MTRSHIWQNLPTIQIPVILLGMDAEEFFHGLPPFDPSKDKTAHQTLHKWASWLAGSDPKGGGAVAGRDVSAGGGGRWLDCCIKLAYMDTQQVALATKDEGYRSPIVRIVQTVGRGPT